MLIPAKVGAIKISAFLSVNFVNATLTIESESVTIGNTVFAFGTSNRLFTTVKMPQAVYNRYNATQLANRFGTVGAYQKLDCNPQ